MNLGKVKRVIYVPRPQRRAIPAPNWPTPRRKSGDGGIPVPNWPQREKVDAPKK